MNNEPESERMSNPNPDLRRRLRLSYRLLFLLALIIGYRVFVVKWPVEGLSWQGFTVGESTPKDVIDTLGWPSKIKVWPTTGVVFEYDKWIDDSWGHPTIYFRANRMIRIRFKVTEPLTVFDFVGQYGKPDYIIDETVISAGRENPSKGVYWLDEGIYLSAPSRESGDIYTITYFRPCSSPDKFCLLAEELHFSGPAPPGEDPWGIMSP